MKVRFPALTVLLAILAAAAIVAGGGISTAPTTPTGIPYVDRVIDAVQTGNSRAFRRLVVYTTVPCTDQKWELNLPLCDPDEAVGTPVRTLPLMSDDLGHLRADHAREWHGVQYLPLYAVYRTGNYTWDDPSFPKGEYAVAFRPSGSEFVVILQVTPAGIVRIDQCGITFDICHGEEISQLLISHPEAFVLGPLDE